jgi:UDP-N-acetylglucosamine--N-acetylmuramyl-(pentapeptide) pyrophosphoryl-undecaprenol N-acetylglucosamine transferase
MDKNFKIAVVTGGTGGHIFPALAVAEELHTRHHDCIVLADTRFLNYKMQVPSYMNYKIVPSGSSAGNLFNKFVSIIKIFFGIIYSLKIYRGYKPNLVIGFGGYTSFPSLIAARILKIPIFIHEQNIVIGKANQFLMKFANVIALSFNNTIGVDLNDKRVQVVGNPVRKEVLKYRSIPYVIFTDKKPINILITGGSQGAAILSKVLPRAFALLDEKVLKRVKLYQQCRIEDLDRVREEYKKLKINAVIEKFFDNIPALIAEAHVVVSRAGASIISELITIGRPTIFIPIQRSIGNHQYLNAKMLVDNEAAWIINEPEFTANNFANLLQELINNSTMLINAANNAKALYDNASDRLVDCIINFCRYKHI